MAPSCPSCFFVFHLPGVFGFSSVHHEPCPTTDFLIIYFRWREGVPTSILGSQPIIWLLSSSPWSGDPLGLLYVTPYPILFPSGHQVQTSVFPFWLGFVTLGLTHILSCFNSHSLMACQFKHEDSSNLISIISVGHHVTIFLVLTLQISSQRLQLLIITLSDANDLLRRLYLSSEGIMSAKINFAHPHFYFANSSKLNFIFLCDKSVCLTPVIKVVKIYSFL